MRLYLDNDQGGRLSASDFQNAEDERFYRTSNISKLNNDNDSELFEGDILPDNEDYDYTSEVITNMNKTWTKIGEYDINSAYSIFLVLKSL